jgi:hypothetical protein
MQTLNGYREEGLERQTITTMARGVTSSNCPYRAVPLRRTRRPNGFGLALIMIWAIGGAVGMRQGQRAAPIEVLSTALTVVAGVGGAVALVVAYRRQRDLEQERFVERFGAAAAQLAPIVLGRRGDRLVVRRGQGAGDNPRSVIVAVTGCACLGQHRHRMVDAAISRWLAGVEQHGQGPGGAVGAQMHPPLSGLRQRACRFLLD